MRVAQRAVRFKVRRHTRLAQHIRYDAKIAVNLRLPGCLLDDPPTVQSPWRPTPSRRPNPPWPVASFVHLPWSVARLPALIGRHGQQAAVSELDDHRSDQPGGVRRIAAIRGSHRKQVRPRPQHWLNIERRCQVEVVSATCLATIDPKLKAVIRREKRARRFNLRGSGKAKLRRK